MKVVSTQTMIARAVFGLGMVLLLASSCYEDLNGNNPPGEGGDIAVVTSQGFPCSEHEIIRQHYGFDLEADPSLETPLSCRGDVSCFSCIPDDEADLATVDLWMTETDDEMETCTYRLVKKTTGLSQEEAESELGDIRDECP